MINALVSGRLGKAGVNNGGFLTLAVDQYKKGAENNRATSWISVYVPEHLREYANNLEKGNAVDVMGQLDFNEDEYNGEKTVRLTLFASAIKKTFAANGGNCFQIKSARLGKDMATSKNGYMLNLAYDVWNKGETSVRWITGFTANENVAKRLDALGAKKGTSLDLIANSFNAEINEKGYLNVVFNIVDVTYAPFNKKKDENSESGVKNQEQQSNNVKEDEDFENFNLDDLDEDLSFF